MKNKKDKIEKQKDKQETQAESLPFSADEIECLRTIIHHTRYLQAAMQKVVATLEARALVHDQSKFLTDEFEGFSRISAASKRYEYGSSSYKQLMEKEQQTIDLHYQRNPHHPEHHQSEKNERMTVFDLIEMVCDWYAAWMSYNPQKAPEHQISFAENVRKQEKRYKWKFDETEWKIIDDVVTVLVQHG